MIENPTQKKGLNLNVQTALDGFDFRLEEKASGNRDGDRSRLPHYPFSRQWVTTSRKISDSVIMPTTFSEASKTGKPLTLLANMIWAASLIVASEETVSGFGVMISAICCFANR